MARAECYDTVLSDREPSMDIGNYWVFFLINESCQAKGVKILGLPEKRNSIDENIAEGSSIGFFLLPESMENFFIPSSRCTSLLYPVLIAQLTGFMTVPTWDLLLPGCPEFCRY
jgi:hypothetical protein